MRGLLQFWTDAPGGRGDVGPAQRIAGMSGAATSEVSRLGLRVAGLVQGVGFRPYVHRLATELGLNPTELAPNASLVLGTAQVSVLEMAAAYNTFSDGGVYTPPRVITKVTTADGVIGSIEACGTHRLPSAPAVMSRGRSSFRPDVNSVIWPDGVTRPIAR